MTLARVLSRTSLAMVSETPSQISRNSREREGEDLSLASSWAASRAGAWPPKR